MPILPTLCMNAAKNRSTLTIVVEVNKAYMYVWVVGNWIGRYGEIQRVNITYSPYGESKSGKSIATAVKTLGRALFGV